MWLSIEADHTFGHGYQNTFKEQFSQYMNTDIETNIYTAGLNLLFAIKAFIKFKKDCSLEDVLCFTEQFISEQLDDNNIDRWCDEIGQAMYEESSEYERECGERQGQQINIDIDIVNMLLVSTPNISIGPISVIAPSPHIRDVDLTQHRGEPLQIL
jgi:hypothetical protein